MWLAAILVGLVAVCFITVTGWLLASPSEEITKAVSASGAKSVKQADPDQFLNAVASVLVGVDQKNSAPYVAAAIQVRPDLKDQIKATARKLPGDTGRCADTLFPSRRVQNCHNGQTLTLPVMLRSSISAPSLDTRVPVPDSSAARFTSPRSF